MPQPPWVAKNLIDPPVTKGLNTDDPPLSAPARKFDCLKANFEQPLKALFDLEKSTLGPHLKAKRAGAVAMNVLDVLAAQTTGSDLGKIFEYGFLFSS